MFNITEILSKVFYPYSTWNSSECLADVFSACRSTLLIGHSGVDWIGKPMRREERQRQLCLFAAAHKQHHPVVCVEHVYVHNSSILRYDTFSDNNPLTSCFTAKDSKHSKLSVNISLCSHLVIKNSKVFHPIDKYKLIWLL